MYGTGYHCETCLNFDLCYKCYNSRHLIHPDHPTFKAVGDEFLPEDSPESAAGADEHTDDDDDSDSDAESDSQVSSEDDRKEDGEKENGDKGGERAEGDTTDEDSE